MDVALTTLVPAAPVQQQVAVPQHVCWQPVRTLQAILVRCLQAQERVRDRRGQVRCPQQEEVAHPASSMATFCPWLAVNRS